MQQGIIQDAETICYISTVDFANAVSQLTETIAIVFIGGWLLIQALKWFLYRTKNQDELEVLIEQIIIKINSQRENPK